MVLRTRFMIRCGLLLALVLLAAACNGAGRIVPKWTVSGGESASGEGAGAGSPAGALTKVPHPEIPPQSASVRFDRHTVEDGLSASTIDSIVQDSQGFVWIGTEDGLNRFDGYSFEIYRHDPQDPNSLSSSNILDLHADETGLLWIGTLDGLNRFDLRQGHFSRYRHDPDDDNSLGENLVTAVYRDRAGIVWVGTRSEGLDRLDPESGTWRHYRLDRSDPHSLSHNYVTDILEDSAGVLWVATASGLNRLEQEGGGGEAARFVRYLSDPEDPDSLSGNAVTALHESRSGDLWLATAGGGLNLFDREANAFVRYRHDPTDRQTPGSDILTSVVEDERGMVWLGTDSGVDRFDPESGQWRHYRHDPGDPRSLSYDSVTALYEDESGGIWIGTRGGGLNRHDWRQERFVHYRSQPDEPNSLGYNMLWALFEDSAGVLWVGTNGGGLSRLDREADRWRHYRHEPGVPRSLPHDSVTSILEDSTGRLWVTTYGGGLGRVQEPRDNGRALSFEHFRSVPGDPQSLSSDWVWTVYEDREGNLWVGTTSGLNRFDRETEQFTRFYHGAEDSESPQKNNVGVVYRDRTGDMWVATQGGLYRFNPDAAGEQTAQYAAYEHDPDDASSLSNNIVFSIHEDGDGVMWFGTWGGGLNRFDRETETFRHYRTRDGLPNDVIYGILEEEAASGDGAGHLWLSTNNGLSRFDPATETFTNYDTDDGLQSIEFNFGAYHRSMSGEMFFGGINGFNAFYPGLVRDNAYVPPIVLTSLTQGGQPAEAGEAPVGQAPAALPDVTFRWPDNDFEFEFAALSYLQPERNQYAYMLEGFDRAWNYAGARRFGSYTNLPGGTYTLRLQGSNNDGLWNEEGTALAVTVVPPFWATWWFRGLLVLALAGVVAGGYRLRLRGIEARSQRLSEQVASRTKELAALNAIAAVVSRSLNVQQVLADALDKTLEVTGLEAGGMYLLQEESRQGVGQGEERSLLKIAIHRGLSQEMVAGTDNLAVGEGFSGHVVESCEPLVVHDLASDPRLTRSVVKESGFHSLAITPLVSRSKVLGSLFVMSRDPTDFSPEDIELLTSIGSQIGVAISNARFVESEQRRAEQFRLIAEVGRRLTLLLDVKEVLEQVVRLVQETFGYYHVAIGLIEGDEVVYRVGAGELWDNPDFGFKPARLKVGAEGVSGWVASRGKPLLVPDVRQEPRYVWMQGSATRSELTVPITIKEAVIGVLDVQSDRPDAFDATDLAVLESLAHQAGVALENARLYEQAQQAAVVEERQRLARDLHDAVTQTLFSASLIAEALPATWDMNQDEGAQLLRELRLLSRGALAEMRTLLMELRPTALVESGLDDLLRQLTDAATGRLGRPVQLKVRGSCALLPADLHVALYRIAQEAMNNIVKHDRAAEVTVELYGGSGSSAAILAARRGESGQGVAQVAEGSLELCIRDDGRGFDLDNIPPDRMGLGIMRERAEAVGAKLEIESEPGSGTCVSVSWPGATTTE